MRQRWRAAACMVIVGVRRSTCVQRRATLAGRRNAPRRGRDGRRPTPQWRAPPAESTGDDVAATVMRRSCRPTAAVSAPPPRGGRRHAPPPPHQYDDAAADRRRGRVDRRCSMAPTPPFVGAIPMKRARSRRPRPWGSSAMLSRSSSASVGSGARRHVLGPTPRTPSSGTSRSQGQPVTGVVCMEDWYALVGHWRRRRG